MNIGREDDAIVVEPIEEPISTPVEVPAEPAPAEPVKTQG